MFGLAKWHLPACPGTLCVCLIELKRIVQFRYILHIIFAYSVTFNSYSIKTGTKLHAKLLTLLEAQCLALCSNVSKSAPVCG